MRQFLKIMGETLMSCQGPAHSYICCPMHKESCAQRVCARVRLSTG